MASQGPLSPSSVVNGIPAINVAWTSPGNAVSSNDSYATVTLFDSQSKYLQATGFGFSITSGATINGIVAEIERHEVSAQPVADSSLLLVKAGVPSGTDHASGTNWPSSDAYATYGSSSDLWGLSWTDSEINASDFGVALLMSEGGGGSFDAFVDHMRITVYYTEAGPTTPQALTATPTASASIVAVKLNRPTPPKGVFDPVLVKTSWF